MSATLVAANQPTRSQRPASKEGNPSGRRRRGLLVVVGMLPLLMGPAQPSPTKVVEAEKFILRDREGKIRAELGLGAGGPSLALLDADGHCRVRLAVLADGSSRLSLYDKEGHDRAVLFVRSEGEPQLDLAPLHAREPVPTSVPAPASSHSLSALPTSTPVPLTVPELAPRPHPATQGLYRRLCQGCHGSDGQGRRVRTRMPTIPNFSDAAWQTARTEGQLAGVILHGRGDDMPAFDDRLSLEQARELAAYIRALGPTKTPRGQDTPNLFDQQMRQLQLQWDELARQMQELTSTSGN